MVLLPHHRGPGVRPFGISHFIDRTGREGFAAIFDGLNSELLRLGMLSPEMYVDSTLVKAKVSGYGLASSDMTIDEFKEQAIEENGLFKIMETTVDEDGVERETARYIQSPKGRQPLVLGSAEDCLGHSVGGAAATVISGVNFISRSSSQGC